MFTLFAMACAGLSFLLVVYAALGRLIYGDAWTMNGVLSFLAVLIFLVSVCMVGIGLIGEYVGRAYQCVQQRPRFVVREIFENPE
jgi:undecaprenyl-phosphate 4-deoxy-4-formamido-L-arabinose transferase